MNRHVKGQTLEQAFTLIEMAAIKGARCPLSAPCGPVDSVLLRTLARRGMLKIELYAKNFRVAEIMVGPNRGKRTASRPGRPKAPWRVTYKDEKSVMRHGGA